MANYNQDWRNERNENQNEDNRNDRWDRRYAANYDQQNQGYSQEGGKGDADNNSSYDRRRSAGYSNEGQQGGSYQRDGNTGNYQSNQNRYGNTGYGNESGYNYGSRRTQNQGNNSLGVGSDMSYNRMGYGSGYGGEYGYRGNEYGSSRAPYDNKFGTASYQNARGDSRNWNPDREYSSYTGDVNPEQERRWQHDNRDWMDRAGDEVRSWFGDESAEYRRRVDHYKEQHPDYATSHRGRGPKNYNRSDERIEENVNDRMHDDHWLDASDIEVQVSNGEVVLSGTVDSKNAKRHAEDLADAISGVNHVENRLRVRNKTQSSYGTGSYNNAPGAGSSVASDVSRVASSSPASMPNATSSKTTGSTNAPGSSKTKS